MSNNGNPKLNNSGYPDPTAYAAIKAASDRIENNADDSANELIHVLKYIIDKSGFKLIHRIEIQHKKTGSIYR